MQHFKYKLTASCFFILMILLNTSCSKDNGQSESDIDFSKGVFIVNEGPFGSGTGTITYFNPETDSLIQDVFSRQNLGRPLGNIAQAMIAAGDKYFISVNNAGKIVVVNRKDFKLLTEITEVSVPRYFAVAGDELLVSAWGPDFNSGEVVVIDVKSMAIKSRIAVGGSPEGIYVAGNRAYVALSTVGNPSRSYAIINIAEQKVEKYIDVCDNPKFIAQASGEELWVICSGNTDFSNPANSTSGALVKVVNDVVEDNFILPNGANYLYFNNAGTTAYFTEGSKIQSIDLTSGNISDVFTSDYFIYAFAFDPGRELFFVSDPGDFSSRGRVEILNKSGQILRKIEAGVATGYIYLAD